MLKRKMLDILKEWKRSHSAECLLINGARQVGKSFIVREFGRSEYESFVEVDFVKNPQLASIFDGPLSAESVFSRMTLLIPGVRLLPGKTLIFFDELQECPAARAAFKYLAQDGRFDVVGSGSLLGMRFRQLEDAPSLPVGYERQVTMRPLDFEEFLWARGYEPGAVDALRGYLQRMEPVPQAVHQQMMRLVREYLAVGGMPEVVASFAPQGDFGAARQVQLKLHSLYLDDIARYAPPQQRVKARSCYLSLPRQLARENTRFRYSEVEKGGSARKFEAAVDWLTGAEVALQCTAVSAPAFPLASYEDGSRFRLYANDTGLLMAMFDFSMMAAVVDNTLSGPMKGGLYENLVAGMLASCGLPLRYWNSKDSKREVEFLVDSEGGVAPIEVKAGRGSTASLNALLQDEGARVGYKLIDGNLGQAGKKLTLPLYLAPFAF